MTHILKHWFLYSLLVVIPSGMLLGQFQDSLASTITATIQTKVIVFFVLFCMSLTLDIEQISRTATRPWGIILAFLISAIIFPLLVWGIVSILPASRFSAGILIMAVVPSTMASAAVWTRKAGGNDALSLLVTLLTNGFCFLVAPFWLWVTLGQAKTLDSRELVIRLLLIAMLPMALGQILRFNRKVKSFAETYRGKIGIAAQIGILSIIFVGSIRSGKEFITESDDLTMAALGLLWIICLSIHLLLLIVSWYGARSIGCSREDSIAVMFSGSQKTLPIAIDLATSPILLASGISSLAIIPPLMYHATQLIVDALIAEKVTQK